MLQRVEELKALLQRLLEEQQARARFRPAAHMTSKNIDGDIDALVAQLVHAVTDLETHVRELEQQKDDKSP